MKICFPRLGFIQLIIYFLCIVFMCTYHNAKAQDITEGRVAFYPFNGNADDHEGFNDGAVYGASPSPDRFGNANSAYYFDGIQSYIQIPDHHSLNFAADEDFSISLWVKIADTQNDLNAHNNEILGKWNTQVTSSYPYAIRYWNSFASAANKGKIFTMRYDSKVCGNNPIINSNCVVSTESWHHLVFLKKGNQISLFKDGVLQESVTDNTSLSCNTKNTNPIFIGKRDTERRFFTGFIDDIAFYNRPLTNDEIKILFEEGQWTAPSNEPDIYSFSFPEQSSPSIIDNDSRTIEIEVPCGTDLANLTPGFTLSEGATAYVGETRQNSGITANDFTHILTYTIVREEACSLQEWDIIVYEEVLSQEEAIDKTKILSFSLPEQAGPTLIDDDQHIIQIKVGCNVSLANLVATFTLAEGAKAKISGQPQESGTTPNNFSEQLVYQVTNSETCTVQDWEVNVERQRIAFEEIDILAEDFFIPNVITPNGDKLNDIFQVGPFFQGSELTIYNRNGKIVSHYENYANQFNGEGLSPGTYFYHLKNQCIQNPVKGPLLIISGKNTR